MKMTEQPLSFLLVKMKIQNNISDNKHHQQQNTFSPVKPAEQSKNTRIA